ncbi:hypothetical protein [Streptomyces sp. NPDC053560]|uniref:hypothetical protein n=1 Tax=Streptomyces sp. NPDC053560 TaxID=3365711 RepID=UPI0037D4D9DA
MPDEQDVAIDNVYLQSDTRQCAACEQDALTVITATAVIDGEPRAAGGWAICFKCGATPHPTMGATDAGA